MIANISLERSIVAGEYSLVINDVVYVDISKDVAIDIATLLHMDKFLAEVNNDY